MIFWFATLFVISIFASQSAMDFFAALLCCAVIYRVIAEAKKNKPAPSVFILTGFDWIWILWLFVVALSFALSPLQGTAWILRLLEFRWILLFYAFSWTLRDQGLRPRAQVPASLILGIFSIYAIGIWFAGYDPIKQSSEMSEWMRGGIRTGGLLSNPMTFAHTYGTAFCLFVGLSFFAVKFRSKYAKFLIPALLLLGLGVLLSFTRGMWISMGVGSLAMAFIFHPRFGALLSAAGVAVVGIAAAIWPVFRERMMYFSNSGDGREWIWKAHWNIFLDHPLTGVGYGENFHLVPEYYARIGAPPGLIVSHAHNQYLHFLAGTGIFGLAIYLLVLALFFRLNWRVYRRITLQAPFHKALALGCLGAQISFWVGGLTEANLEHSKMKSVLLVVWAIVVWLAYEHGVLKGKQRPMVPTKEPL